MTLREIAAEWLKEHGFDGLYSGQCGCRINDLIPCDGPGEDCEAGHIIPCPGPEICELGGDCEWHIGKKINSSPR